MSPGGWRQINKMNSTQDLRNIALEIFKRSLAAIDVESVVRAIVRLDGDWGEICDDAVDLARFNRVIVIAIGKASLPMARAVEEILGDRVSDGLVATNAIVGQMPRLLPVIIGGHPLPNAGSLGAAAKALDILRVKDAEETLVLFLISGGGWVMFSRLIVACDNDVVLETNTHRQL